MANRKDFENVVVIWPVLLLVGFASVNLSRVSVAGYRWTVELALGLFITVAAVVWLVAKNTAVFTFSKTEILWILFPIVLFITWSGLTVFWADSWRAATHHTLLWALYLLFYVLLRMQLREVDSEQTAIKVLGIVILIVSLAGVVEFLGSPKPITLDFTSRFYSYAEAIICLLPLFAAKAISIKTNRWPLWLMLIALSWFLVVGTTSRAMFAAGLIGIAIFFLLDIRFSVEGPRVNRYLTVVTVLTVFTFVPQLSLFSGQTSGVAQRIAGSDEYSQLSARSRLPMWGMAIENFRLHPLTGIGGDNFYSNYKMLRANYSARDPENELLEINEDIIPERAHNEFLQILCELGVVGIALFTWLIVGICVVFFSSHRNPTSLSTLAAFSGISAFLVASAASSYSFRFPTSGLCFFFLLAIAARGTFVEQRESKIFRFPVRPIVAAFLAASLLMIWFSTIRAISIRHFANSQNAQDAAVAKTEMEKAIAIDPFEPVFRYYNAERLYLAGDYTTAVPEFRQAIDHGIATSPAYFDLLATLMCSGRNEEAAQTFEEALRVYPRSVFLRTAHASFLKRTGQAQLAEEEYRYALSINEKQARSWQLAHDGGLEHLVQVARLDENYLSPFDLKPESAPLALANFQRK